MNIKTAVNVVLALLVNEGVITEVQARNMIETGEEKLRELELDSYTLDLMIEFLK